MDFSQVELFTYDDSEYDENDEAPEIDNEEAENEIYQIVIDGLMPYMEELNKGDYFTIYLENGWELGQRKGKKVSKNNRRDGQAIAQDLSGQKKISNLVEKITEQLIQGVNKYQMGTLALVAGVYLWKFKNQRKPSKKEMSAIKGKKRRRK